MQQRFKVKATWKEEPDILVTVNDLGDRNWAVDITDGITTHEGYRIWNCPDARRVVYVLAAFMVNFASMGGTNEEGEPIPETLYKLATDHDDAWGMASADEDPNYPGEHFIEPAA